MRIGIDARLYSSSFTGIGRYVYELIHNVLLQDTKNEYVIFLNDTGFSNFTPPRKGIAKILVNAPHYTFAEQWSFWRALQAQNLDLMHFTHFNAPLLYRKPCVVTIHDLTLNFYPGEKMRGPHHRLAYRWVMGSVVRRSKRIIAVSEHTKNDLIKLLRIPAQKIRVIHEGVNLQFHPISERSIVQKFLERQDLPQGYLLYTGVWRSHKNLVNLIRAFALLKNRYHFPGVLVITGKEDPWYPEVQEAVREERLEGQVRFTGMVPEENLVLLYNGALIYVLPSLYEGFGLPALEAFACGVPVAASQSTSLPEICGEGNAIFFNPRDPADMAAKIAELAADPQRMEALRARGLARVKNFSWEKMARETVEVYEEKRN